MNLGDFLSNEAIDAVYQPVERAQGLPGTVYTDPAFWELERALFLAHLDGLCVPQ